MPNNRHKCHNCGREYTPKGTVQVGRRGPVITIDARCPGCRECPPPGTNIPYVMRKTGEFDMLEG